MIHLSRGRHDRLIPHAVQQAAPVHTPPLLWTCPCAISHTFRPCCGHVQAEQYAVVTFMRGPPELIGTSLLKRSACQVHAWVQGEWLERASEVLNARIARHASAEIRFNLMAIVRDPREALRERAGELQRRLDAEGAALSEAERAEAAAEAADVAGALAAREREHERWRRENARRKHNYVPLIFNLLQVMAERDELMPLLQKARSGKRPEAGAGAGAGA